jgi:hypothetical protein
MIPSRGWVMQMSRRIHMGLMYHRDKIVPCQVNHALEPVRNISILKKEKESSYGIYEKTHILYSIDSEPSLP